MEMLYEVFFARRLKRISQIKLEKANIETLSATVANNRARPRKRWAMVKLPQSQFRDMRIMPQ